MFPVTVTEGGGEGGYSAVVLIQCVPGGGGGV